MVVAELYELYKDKSILLFLLVFLFIGLIMVAVGAFMLLGEQSSSGDIQIVSAETETPGETIFVHVDGAVNRPGVYELPLDSRTNDAVLAAGGFRKEADMARVNLASKISDGQKVLIAKIGDISGSVGGSNTQASGLVSINSATERELDTLPGIGPVTAQKIIASRPYSTLEDLKTKKAVSSSVFLKIKDQIAL